jgi:hypothetical protein
MVVIPILFYVSIIWWPRIKYKISQTKLSKPQRLACLGTTEAIRMATTAAIEVLLELPLPYLKIQAEAQTGIYILNCNEQW